MAERDADDADRTAVEPFSALTAAININFGTDLLSEQRILL